MTVTTPTIIDIEARILGSREDTESPYYQRSEIDYLLSATTKYDRIRPTVSIREKPTLRI